jgi:hypothetical protein
MVISQKPLSQKNIIPNPPSTNKSHLLLLNNVFYLFFTCLHKEKGREIRTNDLHFMRHDLQPIELSLRTPDNVIKYNSKTISHYLMHVSTYTLLQ